MSNSPLVNYKKLSPNMNTPRNHVIDTISIHCVAGNISIETLGDIFASPSRAASSNYGVGTDGRVGMYVEEKNRSWCTGSRDNDHRAVTIEVCNDGDASTGWHVSDKAMNSLIELIADICSRNGIKKLLWKGDKSLIGQVDKQNMTVHRWFANKSCPGDYLYSKHGFIANSVNEILNANHTPTSTKLSVEEIACAVIRGKFGNGSERINKLTEAGYNAAEIQNKVNEILAESDSSVTPPQKASIEDVAREVIQGKWGNGSARVNRLTSAGYNASEIQSKVNDILSGNKTTTPSKETLEPYLVRINAKALNVRKGPSINNPVVKTLVNDKNTYTIVEESTDKQWGKLKSGIGWVKLEYTIKQ